MRVAKAEILELMTTFIEASRDIPGSFLTFNLAHYILSLPPFTFIIHLP